MSKWCLLFPAIFMLTESAQAETLYVPAGHPAIQAAIDAAAAGDTILVAPGRYRERLKLKPGILLRSAGDDAPGDHGLKRAEVTILDGGGAGDQPGVALAEGSTLDGFTITNVGIYDEAVWQRHFDSHGEELGDDEGSVHAEGTIPAVSIRGNSCTVSHCIVHHNGDVGIAVLGVEGTTTAPRIEDNRVFRNLGGGIGVAEQAEPIVRGNHCTENLRAGIGCRKAKPIIIDNLCERNVRAGIGIREGAMPIVKGNICRNNHRAGIGIRMEGTSPIVEANQCHENDMAGIGCRDHASPTLRKNVCRGNRLAGIGARDGARPVILDNLCRENEQAGIGIQGQSQALILRNQCLDNKPVAIGITEGSTATIADNEVSRNGGMPPLIAVKDASVAAVQNNRISGGGVAAVLVQGTATVAGNTFIGRGDKQGTGVWVWEGSQATVADNTFDGYRTAVNATKATIAVTGNTIRRFQKTAIVVQDSPHPARVHGNRGTSSDPQAQLVNLPETTGVVEDNRLSIIKQE